MTLNNSINANSVTPLAITQGGFGVNTGPFSSIVSRVFNVSSSYTPTTNTAWVQIEAVGGGGGAGSAQADLSTGSAGGAGGAGAYARLTIPVSSLGSIPVTITIGSQGAAGVAGNGGDGTATVVGSLITCGPGLGGASSGANTTCTVAAGGAGGTATGGQINIPGQSGAPGVSCSTYVFPSKGTASQLSPPIRSSNVNAGGTNGFARGCGGSGGAGFQNATAWSGGSGTAGQVIIREFIG